MGRLSLLGVGTCIVDDGAGAEWPLEHHRRWASDGIFAWGYAGNGPADLAYSILSDHLQCAPPLELAVRFKDEVIAVIPPYREWELPSADVATWLGMRLSSTEGTTK